MAYCCVGQKLFWLQKRKKLEGKINAEALS